MPEPGQEETVRVVALDRSFHFKCYKCEVSVYCFVFHNCFLVSLYAYGVIQLHVLHRVSTP